MDLAVRTEWIGVPTERMVALEPDMPNEMQVYIDIIVGNLDMDAWDQWVEDWHAYGGDEIAEDINAWYDTVK
jgi:putative aldouronate transport system substrate-binding protein